MCDAVLEKGVCGGGAVEFRDIFQALTDGGRVGEGHTRCDHTGLRDFLVISAERDGRCGV